MPHPPERTGHRRVRRLFTTLVSAAVLSATVTLSGPAAALTGPAAALTGPATVAGPTVTPKTRVFTADAQPSWQTNGTVWAVTRVGGVIYVGGSFTTIRPPGAAPGTREVTRDNMAAFNADTGALLPFSHTFTSPRYLFSTSKPDVSCNVDWDAEYYTCDTIYRIKASPDGSTIYAAGDFTGVDGQVRTKVAAFSTANAASTNPALDRSFAPTGINSRVRALAVGSRMVYVGGDFTQVGRVARQRLAALDRRTAAATGWNASADAEVIALELSADGTRLVVGGDFDQLNGVAQHALGAVSPSNGQSTTWAWRGVPKTSYITDMAVDRDTVYLSSNGEGTWDGRAAVDPHTGVLRWFDSCLGATWAVVVVGDLLYSGSHAHNCNDTTGGFPEQATDMSNPRYYRLLAQTTQGTHTAIQYWFPSTNGGDPNIPATRSPSKLGPRALASDGRYLWVGGQFTTVNNVPQEGLTRFTLTARSQPPSTPAAPTVQNGTTGQITVTWRQVEDLDDRTVTYQLYRGATLIHQGTGSGVPWGTQNYTFTDSGLAQGTTVQYRIRAVDPHGTAGNYSPATSATVGQTQNTGWNDDGWDDQNPWNDGWSWGGW